MWRGRGLLFGMCYGFEERGRAEEILEEVLEVLRWSGTRPLYGSLALQRR